MQPVSRAQMPWLVVACRLRGQMPAIAVFATVGMQASLAVRLAFPDDLLRFGARGIPVLGFTSFTPQRCLAIRGHVCTAPLLEREKVVHAAKLRLERFNLFRLRRWFPAAHGAILA